MAGTDWEAVARAAAEAQGIDPTIFSNQIRAESNFRPNAGSPAGAVGIAQIMPATARGWGVDPTDPHASLNAAAKAMRKYLKSYDGDWRKALAAYNAGVGAVAKYGGVPPYKETQNYIAKILGGKTPNGTPRNAAQSVTASANGALSAAADPKTQALEFVMKGSPFEGLATQRYQPLTGAAPTPRKGRGKQGPNVATGEGVPKRRAGETGQQYLDRILEAKFGLEHDPGTQQTTGGNHQGEGHYDGRATDFGDARNDPATLAAARDYLNANSDALGMRVVLYGAGVPGHADHLHAETIRRAQKARSGR